MFNFFLSKSLLGFYLKNLKLNILFLFCLQFEKIFFYWYKNTHLKSIESSKPLKKKQTLYLFVNWNSKIRLVLVNVELMGQLKQQSKLINRLLKIRWKKKIFNLKLITNINSFDVMMLIYFPLLPSSSRLCISVKWFETFNVIKMRCFLWFIIYSTKSLSH